jgi:hypothetical protein
MSFELRCSVVVFWETGMGFMYSLFGTLVLKSFGCGIVTSLVL